jgi:hypothetical protein
MPCDEEWRLIEMVEVNRISQGEVRRLPGKQAPFFFLGEFKEWRSQTKRRDECAMVIMSNTG